MDFGYIYKISYNGLNYYGSSLKNNRFREHKECYKKWKKTKERYTTSSFKLFKEAEKNNELPTFEIVLCYDKYVCNECMRKEEQKWIDDNDCVNIKNAYTSEEKEKEQKKEYYEKNKQKIKEYYQANKEQIITRQKEYYEKNKQKRKKKEKEQKKEYYEKNKQKIKEKEKVYREANKEKKKEYLKQYHLRKKLEKNK